MRQGHECRKDELVHLSGSPTKDGPKSAYRRYMYAKCKQKNTYYRESLINSLVSRRIINDGTESRLNVFTIRILRLQTTSFSQTSASGLSKSIQWYTDKIESFDRCTWRDVNDAVN